MKFEPTINLYLEYCMSRHLRPKKIESYEQPLRLFVNWLREAQAIEDIENVKDGTKHYDAKGRKIGSTLPGLLGTQDYRDE